MHYLELLRPYIPFAVATTFPLLALLVFDKGTINPFVKIAAVGFIVATFTVLGVLVGTA